MRAFEHFQPETQEKQLNPVEVDAEWVTQYLNSGESFGVISAFLPENSLEANIASHEELQKETIRSKYGYKEIVFRYSFLHEGNMAPYTHRLLLIPQIPLHLLLRLAEIFGQKSVAVRGNNGLDFIRVADEQLLLSIPITHYPLVWCNLLVPISAAELESSLVTNRSH